MRAFPCIHPFLRVGLASHPHRFQAIDKLLPENTLIRHTPLFTNPLVSELKQYVKIAMPWEDHHVYFADATGIPPHVIHAYGMRRLEAKVDSFPTKVNESLDGRQMGGQMGGAVSCSQVARVIESSPSFHRIEKNQTRIVALLEAREASASGEGRAGEAGPKYQVFTHSDGVNRRIPPE